MQMHDPVVEWLSGARRNFYSTVPTQTSRVAISATASWVGARSRDAPIIALRLEFLVAHLARSWQHKLRRPRPSCHRRRKRAQERQPRVGLRSSTLQHRGWGLPAKRRFPHQRLPAKHPRLAPLPLPLLQDPLLWCRRRRRRLRLGKRCKADGPTRRRFLTWSTVRLAAKSLPSTVDQWAHPCETHGRRSFGTCTPSSTSGIGLTSPSGRTRRCSIAT